MNPIDMLVQQADEMVLAGRYREAQALCKRVLDTHPDHLAALCIAGNACLFVQDYATAYERFLFAATLDPETLDAHTGMGLAAQGLGRPQEAAMHFRRALELAPTSTELRQLLATAQPHNKDVGYRRAGAGTRKQQTTTSDSSRTPVSPHGGNAQRRLQQGLDHAGAGRYQEAIPALQQVVTQQPDLPDGHIHLSFALYRLQRYPDSEACCRNGLTHLPQSAQLHNNLGMALLAQSRQEEAVASFLQAHTLDPGLVEVYCNLSITLSRLGRLVEAERISRAGLELAPHRPELLENLGLILVAQSRDQEAMALWRQALAHRPESPQIQFDLATLELKHGDFAHGWRHYEMRAANRQRSFPRPTWQGEEVQGKTVLVWAEQGLGDTLQFMRYLPLLQQRGARVLLEHQAELDALLQGFVGADGRITVTPDKQPPAADYDLQVGLLSLPLRFGTDLQSIPASVPYLAADPGRVAAWKRRMEADASGFRVGLVWAGNRSHINDAQRSLPLHAYAPLQRLTGVRFYSLQTGDAGREAETRPAGMELIDLSAQLEDITDTAAAILNLDLVITVDTMVAHLAGALGRPVWTLLPYNADWRWLLDRDDTPWYPTMRLFRQHRSGDWDGVVPQVCAELRRAVPLSTSVSVVPERE